MKRRDGECLLFVYGTLMRGEINFWQLEPFVREGKPAAVRGRLFVLPEGYPMLHPRLSGWVPGEVYTVCPEREALDRLDVLEGFGGRGRPDNEYERVRLWIWNWEQGLGDPLGLGWVYVAPPHTARKLEQMGRAWPSGRRWESTSRVRP